jgi:hypothetical protein
LGANSAYDKVFEANNKIFECIFSCDTNQYRVIRYRNKYLIYKNNTLVHNVRNNWRQLSEFYEREFGFSVYLDVKEKGLSLAPIAFSFVPYFLDQDRSWKKSILPFDNLEHVTQPSLVDLYYYHLNIKDNRFFKLKSNQKKYKAELERDIRKIEKLEDQVMELRKQFNLIDISIDESTSINSMKFIEKELSMQLKQIKTIQSSMYNIQNRIISAESQINEMERLINNLSNSEIEEDFYCPHCEMPISSKEINRYVNTYNIEFLTSSIEIIENEVVELKNSYEIKEKQYISKSKKLKESIENISEKKNLIDDFVKAKGLSLLLEENEKLLSNLYLDLDDLRYKLDQASERFTEYSSRIRTVNKSFREEYHQNLINIGVTKSKIKYIEAFKKSVFSGSQYCRSTMAFFNTFQNMKYLMNREGFKLPLIIDSPFEGDQDGYNKENIISDILKNYRIGDQMILAFRDAHKLLGDREIKMNINVIDLEEDTEYLLSKTEYNENKNKLEAIINIMQ